MPYKNIIKKIPRALDKRIKLSDEDRKKIKKLYFSDRFAIREIARMYQEKCSRRLVQFVLFPDRARLQAEIHKKNRKDGRYYDKDKWREQMKVHRRYKQKLYLDNKLI